MRKKIISLLAVLFVTATAFATFVIVKKDGTIVRSILEKLSIEQNGASYTINDVDVKNIANIYNKDWNNSDDYERAFTQGYLDSKYYSYDRKKQITSQEFRTLLRPIVERLQPDSLNFFDSRFSDYDAPITRGVATGMAYVVARCIGAEINNRGSWEMPEHFWDGSDNPEISRFLPHWQDVPEVIGDMFWREWGELMASWFWNGGYISPYSGKLVLELDSETNDFNWNGKFYWEDAVRAVTRLSDVVEGTVEDVYLAIDDQSATTPDPTIISDDILAVAKKSTVKKLSDLHKLSGIQLAETMTGTDPTKISNYTQHAYNAARWGFNSIAYMFPTFALIDSEGTKANLTNLKMLDKLVAACVENHITLRISADNLPGAGISFDPNDKFAPYIEDFSYDLTKCEIGCRMWKMLSERYKDIPSEYLIFTPVNGKYEPSKATAEKLAKYMCKLMDQIREVDPSRFIYYSYTGLNNADAIIGGDARYYYQTINEKYDNVKIMRNFSEEVYVFTMLTPGINIDMATHSTFIQEYPLTLYGANIEFRGDAPIKLDGCLPAGTKIDMYIKRTHTPSSGGTMRIMADGQQLEEIALENGDKEYNTSYRGTPMYSGFLPYAESEKKISVTLDKTYNVLTFECTADCAVTWSGIDVYLPESYQVERWYKATDYDIQHGYEESFWGPKKTSRVMICPNLYDSEEGRHITINNDVTFTSDVIWRKSDKETIQAWGAAIKNFAADCGVEVENQTYNRGCTQESMIRYCLDTYGMLKENGFDFWMSDYDLLFEENATAYRVAWRKVENYDGYINFNVELLRALQQCQYK
ncbi:MAG: hypothetical protein IKZ62_06370 [Prevotella sp.]|nr:hypothetical protein [Prevotella sp.]